MQRFSGLKQGTHVELLEFEGLKAKFILLISTHVSPLRQIVASGQPQVPTFFTLEERALGNLYLREEK
jgi:hypothetical protein